MWVFGNHFISYTCIIRLYTLNLCSVICQLYLNKTGEKRIVKNGTGSTNPFFHSVSILVILLDMKKQANNTVSLPGESESPISYCIIVVQSYHYWNSHCKTRYHLCSTYREAGEEIVCGNGVGVGTINPHVVSAFVAGYKN